MNTARIDKRTIVDERRREILRIARVRSLEVRRAQKNKRRELPFIVEDLQRQLAALNERLDSIAHNEKIVVVE